MKMRALRKMLVELGQENQEMSVIMFFLIRELKVVNYLMNIQTKMQDKIRFKARKLLIMEMTEKLKTYKET
jgi:hypothetical protein